MSQLAQRVQRMADELRAARRQRQTKGRRMQDDEPEIPIGDMPAQPPAAEPDAAGPAQQAATDEGAAAMPRRKNATAPRKPAAARKPRPPKVAGVGSSTQMGLSSHAAQDVVHKALQLFLRSGSPTESEQAEARAVVARIEKRQALRK